MSQKQREQSEKLHMPLGVINLMAGMTHGQLVLMETRLKMIRMINLPMVSL
jgi:hypothetical protein